MQTFSKSLKKRARLSSISKTFHPRFFLRKRKERERETVPDPASSPASNRIKSNHDRETVIRISTSVPFSTFFLPLLRNTRQDVSRGQCGIPPRSRRGGELKRVTCPFYASENILRRLHRRVVSLRWRSNALWVTGKASETRERNQDTHIISKLCAVTVRSLPHNEGILACPGSSCAR